MRSEAENIGDFQFFLKNLSDVLFKGGRLFYGWIAALSLLLLIGVMGFIFQMQAGHAVTNMREQVSWGFYISNFSILVGVAAAAVLLVIPAYLYHFKAIKKIVAFGELLAITAVIMASLFLLVDTGRPERFWHAIPFIGSVNLPHSILGWDILVLNGYLLINIITVSYSCSTTYFGKEPNKRFTIPLILLAIPWAVMLHSVTAFIFNGLVARPFWNSSILAPRFLASAFCSGPSLMIIIFQVLRKTTIFEIRDSAIFKLAEIISYAMAINIFLLCAEFYKEYYSDTAQFTSMIYLFRGLNGHNNLVTWIWFAMLFNVTGFLIFVIPKTRKNFVTLNIGCVLVFLGIWIEKGMGLILPGFGPSPLGEIYEYTPSWIEFSVGLGIWALGAMLYTFLVRIVIALDTGKMRHRAAPPFVADSDVGIVAGDIMSKNVLSVTAVTLIEEIRSILILNRISGVPVVDDENRIIGVVSETDIVFSLLHQEPQLAEKLKDILIPGSKGSGEKTGDVAAEVMTSPAITAFANTPLMELTELIAERRIKRVIIVDSEKHPIGVVSQIDIVKSQSHVQVLPPAISDFQI
jgi:molybdopterin-containing oxidoreductase family membrane subunit